MKRGMIGICFLLFAAALVFALSGEVRAAEADVVIYLNGSTGSDANSGLTESAAVQTYGRAYEIAFAEMASLGKTNDANASAKFVLTGDTALKFYGANSASTRNVVICGTAHVFRVIFTSKTGAEVFSVTTYTTAEGAASPATTTSQAYLSLAGPTTFENLTMKAGRRYLSIHGAAGADLTIGENVTCVPSGVGTYITLAGAPRKPSSTAKPASLHVHSGTWERIFVASYAATPSSGKACLYMDGGTANLIASTYSTNLKIPSEIHLENVTVGSLYAAHSEGSAATYKGNVTIEMKNVTVTDAFAIDANAENVLEADLSLSLENVKAPVLDTSKVTGTVHHAATLKIHAEEAYSIPDDGEVQYSGVSGGCGLVLGVNTTLRVTGEVTGSTPFSVSGTPLARAYIVAPASTPDSAFVYAGDAEMAVETVGDLKQWIVRLPSSSTLRFAGRTVVFDSTFSARYLLPKNEFNAYFDAGMTVTALTVTVNGETRDVSGIFDAGQIISVDGTEYYWVKIDGIAAKDADTTFEFSLVCDFGGTAITDSYTDSVRAALTQAASTGAEALRTAANATLAYCAAAATVFGKDASGYVFTPVTPVTSFTGIETVSEGEGAITLCGTSLIMKDELAIRFWARPGSFTGSLDALTLKINGEEVEAEKEINGGYFVFKIAVPLRKAEPAMTAELFADGVSVSNRYTDSVLNYGLSLRDMPAFGADYRALGQAIIDFVRYVNEYLAARGLDGKKVIFIGNSQTFYGKTVLVKASTVLNQSLRTGDHGYFYQICKANGAEVNVTNWTFGNHTLKDLFDVCAANRGCDGTHHAEYLVDRNYDYVVIQQGSIAYSVEENLAMIRTVLDFFREANPDVQFIFLVHRRPYQSNYAWLAGLDDIRALGVTVVEWGKLVQDLILGNVTVPGGVETYNQNSFIVAQSASDGYHPNLLTGYITSLMTYCAITGQSAVGQPYDFCNDPTLNAAFDFDAFIEQYYGYQGSTTNFPEIFASESDMRGLQELMDRTLASH